MKSLETNKVFLILPFLLCVIMAGAQSRNNSSYIEPVGIIEDLSDDELLEVVQRQTFRFFWHGAHPVSGMALERSDTVRAEYYWDYINEAWDEPNFSKTEFGPDACAVGGTGFGIMSVIIAVDRG
ncbi:MAG TPA: hypothetical protein PLH30_05960 [Bacteroidales bacterium]|nr:hypothetical protein [Bacteroidales bacterium]